jgi:hypothetical protein
MIIHYLPLTISVLVPWAFAWYSEAQREAGRMLTSREDLQHRPLVSRRVAFLLPLALVLGACSIPFAGSWAALLTPLYMINVWASFTPTHRYRLNTIRKPAYHPRYLSPKVDYDWWWIDGFVTNLPRKVVVDTHHENYHNSLGYRREIHTAGYWAYALELIRLVAAVIAAAIIITKVTT